MLSNCSRSETYLNLSLNSKEEVNNLARQFSVDKVEFDSRTAQYNVRLWLAQREYAMFESLNIPYELIEPQRPPFGSVEMANTPSGMSEWNKYPTYSTYVQMMENFQTNFPTLCKIDTVLAETPDGHAILAAHISNDLEQTAPRPAFWYSSTIHGDEVVGYYFMLRLIDYILNNQNDTIVQNIIQNVDLWITPLENPDGTYHYSDNNIGSYRSTRANANGYDMNRNYPAPTVENTVTVQPETQAMINFAALHHFVMSANFHGGAELTNYPWDTWTTRTRPHADDAWYQLICQEYIDYCHDENPQYMTEEGGVTEGGDWYVITGSRQDYFNYYQNCREITIEVCSDKVAATSSLPGLWNDSKMALLHYILQCTYGFHGIITDAITGEPIEAKIYVNNHDNYNSEVYSHLPLGDYYRPIKAGTYSVTVSADCYTPKTFEITTTDFSSVIKNVSLRPAAITPEFDDMIVVEGTSLTFDAPLGQTMEWYDEEYAVEPISEGASFQTPELTDTTTYWYESVLTDNGLVCRGDRNSITIYVYADTIITDTTTIDTTATDTTVVDTIPPVIIPDTIPSQIIDHNKFINIYPNPVSNICWIERSQNGPLHIQLFDIFGNCLLQQVSDENKTKINLESYSNGIYFIRIIQNNNRINSYKIVKQ